MASAFTPVPHSRGYSPIPGQMVNHSQRHNNTRSSTKRTRPLTRIPLDQVDEATEESERSAAGCISTSASEASSQRSNQSDCQPPLLDFIGQACLASAWFTSCFPCAVVDINDKDDDVVGKLSRANAMGAMYAAPKVIEVPGVRGGGYDYEDEPDRTEEDNVSSFNAMGRRDSRENLRGGAGQATMEQKNGLHLHEETQQKQEVHVIEEEEEGDNQEPEPLPEPQDDHMETIPLANDPSPPQEAASNDISETISNVSTTNERAEKAAASPKRKKFKLSKSMRFLGRGKKKNSEEAQ